MSSLDSWKFEIYPLWDKEWSEAINEANEPIKSLLNYQHRAMKMLKIINIFDVNPERMAWLSLWTKSFSVIESAIKAIESNSIYILEILSRTIFENSMNVFTIYEPELQLTELKYSDLKVSISKHAELNALREVKKRMRAYAAWCLWNDKRFYEDCSKSEHLKFTWDPNPVENIVSDPEKRIVYEAIFGPLVLQSPGELMSGRKKQEGYLKNAKQRVESWLDHSCLQPWIDKLKEHHYFFELFNLDEKTIRKRLKSMNFHSAIIMYDKSSIILHGKSIDNFFYILENNKLSPKIIIDNEDSKVFAEHIGKDCNRIFVFLSLLQDKIW